MGVGASAWTRNPSQRNCKKSSVFREASDVVGWECVAQEPRPSKTAGVQPLHLIR